jgi:hypothetical protein
MFGLVIQKPRPSKVAQPVSNANSNTLPIVVALGQLSLDGGPAALLQDIERIP